MSAASRATQASFNKAAVDIERFHRGVVGAAVPSGLRIIGEEIMLDVKASRPGKGVPVDEGTLRSSGKVEGPIDGKVTLSFGGASAPYALVQHEDTTLRHTVGEARYLVRGIERWTRDGGAVQRALNEMRAAARLAVGR